MRGSAVFVLLGLTAFGAYSVGRQSAPVSSAPVSAITSPSTLARPVAFVDQFRQELLVQMELAASGGANHVNINSN